MSVPELNMGVELPEPRHTKHGSIHDMITLKHNERTTKSKRMGAIETLVESVLVDLFKSRETVYTSDVVAALDLDYDLVDKIFAKFVKQKKLKD
jgi:hypothetical protein